MLCFISVLTADNSTMKDLSKLDYFTMFSNFYYLPKCSPPKILVAWPSKICMKFLFYLYCVKQTYVIHKKTNYDQYYNLTYYKWLVRS